MSPRRRVAAAFAVFMTAGLLLIPLSYAGSEAASGEKDKIQVPVQGKTEKPPVAKKAKPRASKFLPMKRPGDY